jgi:hypothetical protein
MVKLVQAGLAVLVFVLIISVWNWVRSTLPGSPSGHLEWIMFLVAITAGLVVYYVTTNSR